MDEESPEEAFSHGKCLTLKFGWMHRTSKFQFGERKTKGVKKGGIIRWERTETISSKEIIGVHRNIVVNRHATHV